MKWLSMHACMHTQTAHILWHFIKFFQSTKWINSVTVSDSKGLCDKITNPRTDEKFDLKYKSFLFNNSFSSVSFKFQHIFSLKIINFRLTMVIFWMNPFLNIKYKYKSFIKLINPSICTGCNVSSMFEIWAYVNKLKTLICYVAFKNSASMVSTSLSNSKLSPKVWQN